jgi:hypothetical protein
METDTAGENGHYLRICCHLRSKEDYRYEYEQWREHIHKVWNEVEVIVKDNLLCRSITLRQLVDIRIEVKNDSNRNDYSY